MIWVIEYFDLYQSSCKGFYYFSVKMLSKKIMSSMPINVLAMILML